jgi:hypothetical protein
LKNLILKAIKAHYSFQNKISQIKLYEQTKLKKGFKTASEGGVKHPPQYFL